MTQFTPIKAMADARLNRFHIILLLCCSFIMFFDGYDLIVYGSVLPTLMTEWSLTPDQAGWLGSAALIGMMIGALTLGSLADRIGRRPVVVHGTLLFSLAAIATGLATTPEAFGALRFLTGIFLGGVIPNIVSLMNELAPRANRHALTTIMLSIYSVGSIVATLVALWVLPLLGWKPVFFLSGAALLFLPFLYRWMPESMTFLMSRGKETEARALLRRAVPTQNHEHVHWTVPAPQHRPSVSASRLFREGRLLGTPMVWLSFGMCMLMVYGLNTWLPKIMIAGGYDLGSSLQFLIVLNIGATVGALAGGWLGDRFGNKLVLVIFFALAVVSLILLGTHPGPELLNILLFIAGATTIGTLAVVHAFGADYYPAEIRSTGVRWCSAMGRFGAIAGPILGGALIGLKLPLGQNFLIFAIPGVIAIAAVLLVARTKTVEESHAEPQPAESQTSSIS
ncbi:major facilitator superfamily MFS_1 [Arthrobacter sp. FB24]|uniref:MFS transporter n=1 Tax=Arthrobacter sp. (strain FB24) TaxID=290399 RepID=UPI0000527421|nr:major facilitator superfamily MFS_1 [Arthrobacter sp. FB24]